MKIFMFTWVRISPNSWRGYPHPKDDATVRTEGPNPYKVILAGSGIVIGYGVASHELALGGSFARALTAQTQRGTEVVTITAPGFNVSQARHQLNPTLLADTDIVVLSFGTFEILTLTPPRRWGARLDALVTTVLARSAPTTQIFLVDCNTPKMSTFAATYQRRIAKTAAGFNEQLALIAHLHGRVNRVEFRPVAEDAENIEGRSRYQEWASALVPDVVEQLSRNNTHDQ
ncbi:GDSL-type esterase/lipase family protein [Rhodoglobus sp. NPDC076762]